MHYYQFNIGDYISKTAHLSPEEDLAYRRLLDMYYSTENPIPNNIPLVSRRIRLGSEIVESVLSEFFELTESGYKNRRADRVIAEYYAFLVRQKENGRKGGRPKAIENKEEKTHGLAVGIPSLSQAYPKPNPTINHKPLTINHNTDCVVANAPTAKPQKSSRLSPDWKLPSSWWAWAIEYGLDRDAVLLEAEKFKDYWISKSGSSATKADWSATWRNWIRNTDKGRERQKRQTFVDEHTDRSWSDGL